MRDEEIATLKGMRNGVARFQWVMDQAIPHDMRLGAGAFERYNQILKMLAASTDHSIEATCGVFSALSPNNAYLGNMRDAASMLRAHRDGRAIDSFKVNTYGANKRKAWAIAAGADPLAEITADKTRNFYLNLLDPNDPHPVTIDGHMFNIWNGSKKPLKSRDPLKRIERIAGRLYRNVADDLRKVARKRGMIANQVQGVLWITWRRLNNVIVHQECLWDLDIEKAGLGFLKIYEKENDEIRAGCIIRAEGHDVAKPRPHAGKPRPSNRLEKSAC